MCVRACVCPLRARIAEGTTWLGRFFFSCVRVRVCVCVCFTTNARPYLNGTFRGVPVRLRESVCSSAACCKPLPPSQPPRAEGEANASEKCSRCKFSGPPRKQEKEEAAERQPQLPHGAPSIKRYTDSRAKKKKKLRTINRAIEPAVALHTFTQTHIYAEANGVAHPEPRSPTVNANETECTT